MLLSEWDYSVPLVDPFGGSGTIAIEAALIALDIAPNTVRPFAFERFAGYDPRVFVAERTKLDARALKESSLVVRCIDSDPSMGPLARDNIERAGLARWVSVETAEFPRSVQDIPAPYHCVTNPPYGHRLKSDDLAGLYRDLSAMYRREGVTGGFITSYPIVDAREYRNRKLRNGAIECRFYTKSAK